VAFFLAAFFFVAFFAMLSPQVVGLSLDESLDPSQRVG
jgi:hypothetical protein